MKDQGFLTVSSKSVVGHVFGRVWRQQDKEEQERHTGIPAFDAHKLTPFEISSQFLTRFDFTKEHFWHQSMKLSSKFAKTGSSSNVIF